MATSRALGGARGDVLAAEVLDLDVADRGLEARAPASSTGTALIAAGDTSARGLGDVERARGLDADIVRRVVRDHVDQVRARFVLRAG